jgi:hypothetical protein
MTTHQAALSSGLKIFRATRSTDQPRVQAVGSPIALDPPIADFLIFALYRRPGDPMGRLLAACWSPVGILDPGVIERAQIDLLSVLWQMRPQLCRKVFDGSVGHVLASLRNRLGPVLERLRRCHGHGGSEAQKRQREKQRADARHGQKLRPNHVQPSTAIQDGLCERDEVRGRRDLHNCR